MRRSSLVLALLAGTRLATEARHHEGSQKVSNLVVCHCNNPNDGIQRNGYHCEDGSTGSCGPAESCLSSDFVLGLSLPWKGCQVMCSCDQMGGTGEQNTFACDDSATDSCGANEACVSKLFPRNHRPSGCRGVLLPNVVEVTIPSLPGGGTKCVQAPFGKTLLCPPVVVDQSQLVPRPITISIDESQVCAADESELWPTTWSADLPFTCAEASLISIGRGPADWSCKKCVTPAVAPTLCPAMVEKGNRYPSDTFPDTFAITIEKGQVCATRLDRCHGWHLHLEFYCQVGVLSPTVPVLVSFGQGRPWTESCSLELQTKEAVVCPLLATNSTRFPEDSHHDVFTLDLTSKKTWRVVRSDSYNSCLELQRGMWDVDLAIFCAQACEGYVCPEGSVKVKDAPAVVGHDKKTCCVQAHKLLL